MKKILISILLIIIMISLYTGSYAAITVTEDSFQQSVTKILDPNNTLFKIDKVNDTITGVARNFVIKYNFDNNATFTLDFNFTKEMTSQQCKYEHQCISFLTSMFQVVSDHFGIDKNASLKYFTEKTGMQEDVKKLTYSWQSSMDNYDDAIKYAKSIFDNEINYSDSLFTIKSKKLKKIVIITKHK